MHLNFTLAAAGSAVLVGGALIGIIRWGWPKWRGAVKDVVKVRDTILGRDAIMDSTVPGRVLVEPLDGMGVRQQRTEEQVASLAEHAVSLTAAVEQIAQTVASQGRIEQTVNDHEKRLVKLETSEIERVASRMESTQAFKTIEAAIRADPNEVDLGDQDVIDVEPDEDHRA